MKVPRTPRQAASTFAAVILPLVLGCGGDDGTGTDDTDDTVGNPLVGTWTATSVEIDGVEALIGTSLSFTVTMNANETFSESVSGDLDQVICDVGTSCTDNGTYEYTSTTLSFCDPGCDEVGQYTIESTQLTYVLVEDGVTFTVVLTNGPVTVFNPFLGTWTATNITVDGVEVLLGSLLLVETFNDDGTFSESVTGDTNQMFCDVGTSCTDSGTYLYNTTHLSFCDPACDELLAYTISGTTLIVTVVDGAVTTVVTLMRS